jgi:hypothetical protein
VQTVVPMLLLLGCQAPQLLAVLLLLVVAVPVQQLVQEQLLLQLKLGVGDSPPQLLQEA